MKVAFYTLGCKVNHYETEALQELFLNASFELGSFKDYADVYIINTCTVTNNSDVKSRKIIRQAIKTNPDAVICVIGCYSQINSHVIETIPGVDIIMGTSKREYLLDNVLTFLRERKFMNEVEDISRIKTIDKLGVSSFTEYTRAFIKIQDGCDRFCSYCIIPYARGPMRSRPFEDIINEAKNLANKGYLELVLTGIHTGGYGTDLPEHSFYNLLKSLSEIKTFNRIRISSIEMNELSSNIIDLIASNPIFARHLHIPLQSGSNTILKKMRRHYSIEDYSEKLSIIRSKIPNIAITTDLIAGYPEETDDDYETIYNTVQMLAFSEMHIFPYSKRSGTEAALVKNQVHGSVKTTRVNELLKLNEIMANNYIKTIMNETHHVLIETCDKDFCYGYTSEYIRVQVKTNEKLENTMQQVRIIDGKYPLSLAILMK